MGRDTVTVITINWNSFEDTSECLKSLALSAYENLSVIVVDNASEAGEAEELKREFEWIQVLAMPENIGFSGGCNAGIRSALDQGAEFVLLLNNDTTVPPEMVGELVSGYRELKDAGAISPVILKQPPKSEVWFSNARWRADWRSAEVGFTLTDTAVYDELRELEPYQTGFACGCCLLVSADVISKTGLFDERYFAFYDEAEWCARMHRKGYRSYVIPSAHMFHKVGGSTPSLVMTYLMSRNRLLWMRENLSIKGKMKAAPPLIKELVWHLLNSKGAISERKRYSSPKASRAYLLGWRDFLRRRFGKWSDEIEPLLFDGDLS